MDAPAPDAADATSGDAGASDAADATAAREAAPDGAPVDSSLDRGAGDDAGLPLPSPLYGVTVDEVTELPEIVASLQALPRKPTTRIVFNLGVKPAYYAKAVAAIGAVSYVMGELVDSSAMKRLTVAQYTERTSAYLSQFPAGVDLWEVGNEINGNWLGSSEAEIAAKMTGAFDLVKAAGGHTELTLYACTEDGKAYTMDDWVDTYVPQRMLTGLDYVLVSFYQGDCNATHIDWPVAFQHLRQRFPTAGLGFGEAGYVNEKGQDLALADEEAGAAYVRQTYGMSIPVAGYVGGYFWWYFREDMVPSTQPLLGVLASTW